MYTNNVNDNQSDQLQALHKTFQQCSEDCCDVRGEGPWRRKKKEMDAPRVSYRNGNQIVGGGGGGH